VVSNWTLWTHAHFGLKLDIVRYHENIHSCRPGSKRTLIYNLLEKRDLNAMCNLLTVKSASLLYLSYELCV